MPRTAFTSGPLTTGTAADGGGPKAWSNVNNSKVEDGAVATSALIGPGGGGGISNQLNLTNFGFAIPSNAVIDGIMLEIKVDAGAGNNDSNFIYLLRNGGSTSPASTPNSGQNWFHSGVLTWQTYGNATSLWGRVWTPAEINHANFGASIATQLNTGTGTVTVDSVRITVYWHYSVDVTPADVPKRYTYKVFNDGVYLGNLPKVLSTFGYPLDINSVGAALTIECGISADRSVLPGDRLVTEAGDPITTEAGEYIYTDGQPPLISRGNAVDPTIIQNGNRIEVWEYGYYYPNGKLMYKGQVNRIEAGYGQGAENKIRLGLLSDGLDLDNYIARGSPFAYTPDVSQTAWDTWLLLSSNYGGGGSWVKYGQTVTVATANNLGAIQLMLYGTADLTVNVWNAPNGGQLLASTTQRIDVVTQTAFVFGFASLVPVAPGTQVFYEAVVANNQSLYIYGQSGNPYAGGKAYISTFSGGSGGGAYSELAGIDLYFITSSGLATTTATYTSKDPSTEMLKPIIDDYRLRGGLLNYATGSVDATALSLTVTFNTETILDAMKKILSVAPTGFYFYVDLGTDTIYFKQTLTTPTYKLIKGRHLNKINFVMSIENVKNDLLFSGAESAGTNLYSEYEDATSQSNYSRRLERKSDNRVSIQATADAIGNSFIAENKDEYFETTVTVMDGTIDITQFKPGQTVGLRGFGSFVDALTLQIVRMEYSPNSVNLTLGNLPKRFTTEFESVIRGLIAQQTVANPSAPS